MRTTPHRDRPLDFVPAGLFDAPAPRRALVRRDGQAHSDGRRSGSAGAAKMPVELQVGQLVAWVSESLTNVAHGGISGTANATPVQQQLDVYNRAIDELQRVLGNQSPVVGEAFSDFWGGYRAAASKHHAEGYVKEISRCAPHRFTWLLALGVLCSASRVCLCRASAAFGDEHLNAYKEVEALSKQLADKTVDRSILDAKVQELTLQVEHVEHERDEAQEERDSAFFGRAALQRQIQHEQESGSRLQVDFDALMQDNVDLKRKQASLQGELSQLRRYEKIADELDAQAIEKMGLEQKVAELGAELVSAHSENAALVEQLEESALQHQQELDRLASEAVPMVSNLDGSRKLVNRALLELSPGVVPDSGNGSRLAPGREDALDDFWGIAALAITAEDLEASLDGGLHVPVGPLPLMQLTETPMGSSAPGNSARSGDAVRSNASRSSNRTPATGAKSAAIQKLQSQIMCGQRETKRLMFEKSQQTVNFNQERKRRKEAQAAVAEMQETVLKLKRKLEAVKAEADAMTISFAQRREDMDAAQLELVEKNNKTVRELKERVEVERKCILQLERAKNKAEDKLKMGHAAGYAKHDEAPSDAPTGFASWRADWQALLASQSESESALDPMPVSSLLRISATILAELTGDLAGGGRLAGSSDQLYYSTDARGN